MARREAYWMIVFIFLQKQLGIDISESFSESNNKVHHMLKDVNLNQFGFNQGFLECGGKKVSDFQQIEQIELIVYLILYPYLDRLVHFPDNCCRRDREEKPSV